MDSLLIPLFWLLPANALTQVQGSSCWAVRKELRGVWAYTLSAYVKTGVALDFCSPRKVSDSNGGLCRFDTILTAQHNGLLHHGFLEVVPRCMIH